MIRAVASFYRSMPRSKYFYLFVAASPALLVVVPLGMLLSHPMYTASLDLAVVGAVLTGVLSTQSPPPYLLSLVLLVPSVLRLLSVRYVHGLTSAQTLQQKQALALLSLLIPAMQLAVYATPSSLSFPRYAFALPFASSLLVLLSIVWVPTSHQQAWQAESALLHETHLFPHVKRHKVAGLSYLLLDHPVHSTHSAKQSKEEQDEAKEADNSLSHPNSHYQSEQSESPKHSLLSSSSSASLSSSSSSSASSASSLSSTASATSQRSSGRQALFLLHGYGAGAGFFIHSLEALASRYDVYSVDLLGFGMSDHDAFHAKTPQEAEAHYTDSLHRLQLALGIDQVVLLGHSFGGMIAAAYALRFPAFTRAIILVSPVGIPNPPADGDTFRGPAAARRFRHVFRWIWSLGLSFASGLHFAGPFGPMVVRWLIDARFGRLPQVQATPSLASYLYHINAGKGSGLSTLNALLMPGAYARSPLGVRMSAALTVPCWWLYGAHDWMDSEEAVRVLGRLRARGVPGSRIIIQDAGHQVSLENLPAFNAAVLDIGDEIDKLPPAAVQKAKRTTAAA